MKLLHAADLHLDRAFEGLKKTPTALDQQLKEANPTTLKRIVDLALQQAVDLVILAGDTFHQSRTSIQTQALLMKELQRLAAAEIPVALTFGNHDYYVAARYWFDFPENVLLFTTEQVETKYLQTRQQENVALSAFSYEHPWLEANKVSEFPLRETTQDFHIGIYHGDTTKNGAQSYAPFSLTEMKQKGYDYWALGHIHQPQVLSQEPLIVYPGTPQGHTKKEQGVQGVALVELHASGQHTLKMYDVAAITWRTVHYDLSGLTNAKTALQSLVTELIAQKQTTETVQFVGLSLSAVAQMDEEFQLAYESGELVAYLQETVWQKTQRVFVYEVQVQDALTTNKTWIQASPELLKQLSQTYIEAETFNQTLAELTQNPLFTAAITVNQEWRQQSVSYAEQLIYDQFTLQEDNHEN